MYIGRYAAAAVLVSVTPDVPVVVAAVGVAWPDLVWPALVLARRERVTVSRDDALQRAVSFDSYPISHSLVLSNALALIPAAIVAAACQSWVAGLVFWLAAISHWILDLVVHLPDLPVLGFGAHDRTLGAGLWRWPKTSFALEYLFFAVTILAVAPASMRIGVLGGGLLLHLCNANSAFAFTRGNPLGTPARFATVTLVGYLVAIAWFTMAWQ